MPQIETPINNATSTELTTEGGQDGEERIKTEEVKQEQRITNKEFDYKAQIWVKEKQKGGRGGG